MQMSAGLTRSQIVDTIEQAGVVAVIRLSDARALSAVVHALVAGGVRALEVTMTVPGAVELIHALAPTLPDGCLLGAGTVTDPDTVDKVIAAGARFVVSPVFRPAVIEAAHRHNAAAVPGCFSPTEILAAWDTGADIVKVFPASALGPAYFKDLRGPLPHVKLMPTGGVTIDNAGEWIRAGAVAVGVGGALVDATAIKHGEFGIITQHARRLVANVSAARKDR
ncbi:MAG: bifunctional 4-hydroxy-2-oxoglutarate aldolase/2-dehydro-3-deoxy-phosphogluconate aldolase [Vicinamibacterales bacterium]